MSSSSSEETVSAPPAKKQKTTNSDSVANSFSQENHSMETVRAMHVNRVDDFSVSKFNFPFVFYAGYNGRQWKCGK